MGSNDPYGYPPRGLTAIDAARYLGIGLHLFSEMVKDGRLPRPKCLNSRVVYDRVALDVAFSALPEQERDARSSFQKLLDSKPMQN
ncbi:helix-turn-helix domain-containing protein [Pararhizobium sp. BT-229]|uniref:helix-turn-helix domain-containing protein n=1 Tax=Pararhizobium sp. BT-229 TaxID=2986923 RepID=UPI0021F784E0|nr:helix-turn-helix domain-containing protein [Pararhizobium sp. BT-229]MCV9961203.1 helix-turn-helix domain-containing protein [Pararhizobium sp. BT-229]